MKKIERDKDVIYKNNDLEHLHTFKNFPVFMGCTDAPAGDDVLSDMSWFISKKSGMIQLNPLLPLDVVYKSEHGSGTVGKSWDEHHQAFADFVCQYDVSNVLEIGGLHGILSQKVQKINSEIGWTIVEPNPIVSDDIRAKIIQGFFDENFTSDDEYDAVIHSHVLEHVYDPDSFMRHKSSFISTGGLLMFSVPNMDVMIKNNYTNCINFEHTLFLGEVHIEHLLTKFGFEIVEKRYYKEDHSIFYCSKKNPNIETIDIPDSAYDRYSKLFNDYIDSHIDDVNRINHLIDDVDIPVYLFGAHVFSQYLISFGLNTTNIVGLLDNDILKRGKRLYGTNLISHTPSELKEMSRALIILRAGVYNEEVREDILININSNVIFI